MPHLVGVLAISFFTMALIWFCLKPIRFPLLIYFIAYTATTVIGAAALLDDAGLRAFELHQPMFRPEDYPLIGSTTYWLLLLMPFFLVPVGATLGFRAADIKLLDRLAAYVTREQSPIVLIVYSIVGACAGYCFWKLISTNAYFPDLFFDRSIYCNARLVRRTELFSELRYLYYAFTYAVIPIGATVALLSWKNTGSPFHTAIFAILLAATLYFNFVLYMKANLVVVFLTMLLAGIVAKARLRFLIALGSAAIVCMFLMQTLLGCYVPDYLRSGTFIKPALAESGSPQEYDRLLILAAESQPARPQPGSMQVVVDAAVVFVRSAVFRMAASMPYYVQIFSNPDERCGIESNSLPLLPRESCYPATKVGTHVNPGEIQAFQSAPAHIHAYAELGLGYAFAALLLGGLVLGVSWGVARKAESPLFWSAGAAVCVFAYYLTQSSLVGALSHSYGLIWYLFPLLMAVMIHAVARFVLSQFERSPGSRSHL
jgi:hypothetical protein